MKKILSLTLVAVMLLTTLMLSSCEFMDTVMDFVNDIMGKEEEVRTTISEEEWNNAFKITNFTFEVESEGYGITMAFAGSLVYYNVYEETSEYSLEIVADLSKGLVIQKTDEGWLGQEYGDSLTDATEVTLETLNVFGDVAFADLTYDEATKSYTYKDDTTIYSFKFENGVLMGMEMLPADVTVDGIAYVKNIGTTTVEVPEYELYQPSVKYN